MYKVGAVVVTYNINEKFNVTINSLRNQVEEIVVVDNGSCPDTIKVLDNLKSNITLIKLNENKGIAYALNKGIDYCIDKEYDWIITLDHDSVLSDNMISKMLTEYNNLNDYIKEKTAMIVPKHIEEKIYNLDYLEENINESKYEEVLTEITSGAMVKTQIYKEMGKYDNDLFIDSVDHDYCLFLNRKGFKVLRFKSAILKHNLGDTKYRKLFGIKDIAYSNHSPLRRYYISRNRLYIWKKYKGEFDQWIKSDKKTFIRELLMIAIFEENKIAKFKMTFLGIRDYLNNKKGKFR
ncbi:glycosyltransferase family 2 protein [Clostridium perfringens]